jgi:hypothetical protein
MKKASLVENSTNSSEFSSTLNTTHHLTTWPACWRSPSPIGIGMRKSSLRMKVKRSSKSIKYYSRMIESSSTLCWTEITRIPSKKKLPNLSLKTNSHNLFYPKRRLHLIFFKIPQIYPTQRSREHWERKKSFLNR